VHLKRLLIHISLVPLLLAAPVFAHHGSTAYDLTKSIAAKATVTNLEWNNPHCLLHFDAKDTKGEVQHWTIELYNPLYMSRAGWTKNTLKPGDEIEILFHPAKNGASNGYIRYGDGKITFHGQELNLNEDGPGATYQ